MAIIQLIGELICGLSNNPKATCCALIAGIGLAVGMTWFRSEQLQIKQEQSKTKQEQPKERRIIRITRWLMEKE